MILVPRQYKPQYQVTVKVIEIKQMLNIKTG